MEKPLPTGEVISEALHNVQKRFHTVVDSLSVDDLQRPFTAEGWSARDFLAHMAYWKREMNGILIAYTHDQPLPPAVPDGDDANEEERQHTASMPLAAVQLDWEETHKHLLHLFADELDDARLAEEVRVPWDGQQTEAIGTLVKGMLDHDAEHFDLIEQHFNNVIESTQEK